MGDDRCGEWHRTDLFSTVWTFAFSSFSNGNLHQRLMELKKAAWPPKLSPDVTSLFRCAATCLTGGLATFAAPTAEISDI